MAVTNTAERARLKQNQATQYQLSSIEQNHTIATIRHRRTMSYYGLSPEAATREFDSLRREATRLERVLEDKVARYGQVRFVCFFCDG